jgi:glycosyltransferase involved in cell wall biosynthesis
MKPVVSILIPAYNAAQYVDRAIESVLSQTYPVRELFIVDDGSKDRTSAIAESMSWCWGEDNWSPA